jgi:hypothetical protein
MQIPSTFQRFMQELLQKMALPNSGRAGMQTSSTSKGHIFEIEVIEGQTGHVAFCVKLGLPTDSLNAEDLRRILAHNQPQAGAASSVIGLHHREPELCLWCRESVEDLKLSSCADMLNRLVHQAEEWRNSFDAPAPCAVINYLAS